MSNDVNAISVDFVFVKMNPKILQNSKEDGQLFERVWQIEFYCTPLKVLPGDIFLSVDVGKAIIDLRNSNKKVAELEKCKKNDIYVYCAENFESVQLTYSNGNTEDVRLLGEENLLGYDISELLDPMEID
ncbi:hypothetical protein Glove_320g160 [Diversispora epigaea]|uniref:Uncharacterized protein n=1 Tax=Diversispora epigaea TaxID=1348612 RepID=A0A397HNU0_9GLOM|nr:hypothetical protein Glove_320g160 [Diversispora epigaea]